MYITVRSTVLTTVRTDVDDDTCADPGPPNYMCVQGYGNCTDGTHDRTANAGPYNGCGGGVCQPPQGGCGSETWNPTLCECQYSGQGSPITIDTTGAGFSLTSADKGVLFDFWGDGRPIRIAWTSAGSGNAFLALDRNHNGRIDSAREMFGNITEQQPSADPNGFLALAEFDRPENGGNGDGIIDSRDAVFSHLLLWVDENHDGISQPNELHALPDPGVFSIDLHYRDEPFTDKYGNWFRYRAALNPDPQDGTSTDGRWTYDVFLEIAGIHSKGFGFESESRAEGSRGAVRRNIPMLAPGFRGGRLVEEPTFGLDGQSRAKCLTTNP
jgi:hypothetical protein